MTLLQQTFRQLPINIIAESKNRGPGSARDRGWEAAKYPYIAFLDADDSWEREKIALQYTLMSEDEEIMLSGHLLVWERDDHPQKQSDLVTEVRQKLIRPWQALLSNQFKTTSTIMVRRDLPIRFPEDKRYAEDFQFLCEAILTGHKAIRIESPLVRQFKAPFGSGGLSKHIWSIVKGEQETYTLLYKSGKISYLTSVLLIVYLYLKALRRVTIVFTREKVKSFKVRLRSR